MARVKDVVCGMMIEAETAVAKTEYKGETFYFCAPGCRAAFEKDPQKYLQAEGGEPHAGGHHHNHGH